MFAKASDELSRLSSSLAGDGDGGNTMSDRAADGAAPLWPGGGGGGWRQELAGLLQACRLTQHGPALGEQLLRRSGRRATQPGWWPEAGAFEACRRPPSPPQASHQFLVKYPLHPPTPHRFRRPWAAHWASSR
jgi:hypothetical protein